MRRTILGTIMSLLFVSLFSVSCASPKKEFQPSSAQEFLEKRPDDWLNFPQSSDSLYATGTELSPDYQLAIDKSRLTAEANLIRFRNNYLHLQHDRVRRELGIEDDAQYSDQLTQIEAQVSAGHLSDYTVQKTEVIADGDLFRGYVRLAMQKSNVDKEVNSAMRRFEELYRMVEKLGIFSEDNPESH